MLLEASGNITIEGERNVRAVAETGVDIISAGAPKGGGPPHLMEAGGLSENIKWEDLLSALF